MRICEVVKWHKYTLIMMFACVFQFIAFLYYTTAEIVATIHLFHYFLYHLCFFLFYNWLLIRIRYQVSSLGTIHSVWAPRIQFYEILFNISWNIKLLKYLHDFQQLIRKIYNKFSKHNLVLKLNFFVIKLMALMHNRNRCQLWRDAY